MKKNTKLPYLEEVFEYADGGLIVYKDCNGHLIVSEDVTKTGVGRTVELRKLFSLASVIIDNEKTSNLLDQQKKQIKSLDDRFETIKSIIDKLCKKTPRFGWKNNG